MTELIVPRRFCGPPDSGNGGWTAGSLAVHDELDCPDNRADRWPAIEVTLRRPPPLDVPMHVTEDGGVFVATFGGAEVASARHAEGEVREVDPVDPATAGAAEASYAGLVFHPFPTCFSCGTAREEGDGLRIFPGPVGQGRVAATWTPHPSLSEDWHTYADEHRRASAASTWASLDCVGAWAGDFGERLMVLGRMTARIDTLPVVGEEHVVVGEARGSEGRKTFTAATLFDSDGRVVGSAEHVWISVDPTAFGGVSPR